MNMKKNIKNRIALVLMVITFSLLGSMAASAKTYKATVGVPINWSNEYYLYTGPKSGISKVKSSNKKVGTVVTKKAEYGDTANDISVYLKLKKTGKTTVTYKVKENGKTKSYKTKLVVYKYKNPFKTLKVGKVNYKSDFKGCDYSTRESSKGKITVKVKKGWKVKGIYARSAGSKWKKLKKNATVDIAKKHSVMISLKNKKGFIMNFYLWGAGM